MTFFFVFWLGQFGYLRRGVCLLLVSITVSRLVKLFLAQLTLLLASMWQYLCINSEFIVKSLIISHRFSKIYRNWGNYHQQGKEREMGKKFVGGQSNTGVNWYLKENSYFWLYVEKLDVQIVFLLLQLFEWKWSVIIFNENIDHNGSG